MEKSYSIGDVAKITGITEKQLRFWEEKAYIPEPERVNCGDRSYRRYSEEQIEFLKAVKAYLDYGYQLRRAIQLAKMDTGGEINGG